jgi:hypothetical protein
MLNFMALYWPKTEKRIQSNLGGQFATLGANVLAFTGLAYHCKDIVFRFIIEYSSFRDFGP